MYLNYQDNKKQKNNSKNESNNQLINLFKSLPCLIDIPINPFPNILFYTSININISKNELNRTSIFYTFSTFLKSLIEYLNKEDPQNIILITYGKYKNKEIILNEIKELRGGIFLYEIFEKMGANISLNILKSCWIIEKEYETNEYKLIAGSQRKLSLNYFNIKSRKQTFYKIINKNITKKNILINIPNNINILMTEYEKKQIKSLKKKFEKFKINSVLKQYFEYENKQTNELKLLIKNRKTEVNDISIKHFNISANKILNFIFLIIRKTMKDIFDNYNIKILRKDIERIIYSEKKIKWYKTHLLEYKIKKLNLFKKEKRDKKGMEIKRNIFIEILNIIIIEIIIPLINNNFYYIELQYDSFIKPMYLLKRTSLIYFNFCRKSYEKEMIKIKLNSKILKNKQFFIGNSFIKTKEFGYRTLFDLSKSFNSKLKIANKSLKETYLILKEKILNGKNKLINGIYKYEFIFNELNNINFNNKFIIKIDAIRCYDNINREIIKRTINAILKEESYNLKLIKKLPQFINSNISEFGINKLLKTEFIKQINEKIFNFGSIIKLLGERNIKITKKEILNNISIICDNMIIKSQNEYFIRKSGIPQGSNLSNILCLLYFAYLDCRFINNIFKNSKVIRYYDDALIITDNLSELEVFISKKEIFENLGFKFDIKKFEINSKESINNKKVINSIKIDNNKIIKWCGLEISNKGISIDFLIQARNFINYERPGHNLKLFLIRFMHLRSHKVFFKKSNNFRYKNIFKIFNLYFKILKSRFQRMPFINNKLLNELIKLPINILKEKKLIFNINIFEKIHQCALKRNLINYLIIK